MASEQHNPYGSSAPPQASTSSCGSVSPANVSFSYGSVVYPTGLAGRAGSGEVSSTPPTQSPSSAPLSQASLGAQAMMGTNPRMRRPMNLGQLEQELLLDAAKPGQQHQFQQHPHAQLRSYQHGQPGCGAGGTGIMTTVPSSAAQTASLSASSSALGGSTQQAVGNLATRGDQQAPEVSAFSSGSGQEKMLYGHHSSSYLANENYIAGMSSDSELTSGARGHHRRPYGSQSRVYHAHPAPRVNAASSHTSSRLSHYSDSASASYSAAKQMSSSLSLASQAQQVDQSLSSTRFQAQASGSGRQLPARPGFKQSISIDQHQQAHLLGRLGSPAHLSSQPGQLGQYELGSPGSAGGADVAQTGGAPSHLNQQQQQRWLSNVDNRYPAARGPTELELVEAQAANLSLYVGRDSGVDKGRQMGPHLPAGACPMSLDQQQLQMHAKQHLRQQSPINQHQSAGKYDAYEGQQSAVRQHSRAQLDLLAAHKVSSVPSQQSSWLLPGAQHLSAAGQASQGQRQPAGRLSQAHFKQAMSIDHYASSGGHHYSPVGYRTPSLAANFDERYRPGLGPLISGYYQQGDEHQDYGSSASNEYLSGAHAVLNQDNFDSVQQAQTATEHQSQLVLNSPASSAGLQMNNYNNLPPPVSLNNRQAIVGSQTGKLQHQFSSSSSGGANSQSGSLRSSNLELNKQTPPDAVQKLLNSGANNAAHQANNNNSNSSSSSAAANNNSTTNSQPPLTSHQSPHNTSRHDHLQHHHQRGVLKKGYTASTVSSSLAGSLTALNEPGDLSPTQATNSAFGPIQSGKRPVLRATSPSATFDQVSSGSSATQSHSSRHYQHQHHHHHHQQHYQQHQLQSASSTKDAGAGVGIRSESSTGLPNGGAGGSSSSSSLTKKSNSATQLSMTGTKKRLGFRKKQVTSFSVHRSEEVAPLEARHLVKQGSSVSEGDSSVSGDSSLRSWSNSNFKQPTSDELASMSFIDGLGKGQMISRQGLASPYLGDIQLSLCDRRGNLEVEVIRARNLQAKTNKVLPLTYVKLYLVKNRKCMAKAKTTLSNKRTLDPLFQQQLTFHEDYHGCILQSIIWGNFGKMDKKNFMGIAQISIDDLELSDTVISWYKLFLPSSLQTLPSKSLRHTLLSNSTESFTNTNNS